MSNIVGYAIFVLQLSFKWEMCARALECLAYKNVRMNAEQIKIGRIGHKEEKEKGWMGNQNGDIE